MRCVELLVVSLLCGALAASGQDGQDGRARLTSGTTAHVPLVAGRLPYNCLHWSFCRTNGWTEPVLLPLGLGPSLRQLLEREGFGTIPVDCSAATGHVCMFDLERARR